MTWDSLQQFLRILLQLLAGALVQRGYITAEMGVTFTGALLSLGGIAWWALWQRKRIT
jgi:hypothetical protein